MSKCKSFRHHLTRLGIESSYEEYPLPRYYIFCDVFKAANAHELSPLPVIQKAIHEKLNSISINLIDEKHLTEALKHSNHRLLKYAQKTKQSIRASVIIIVFKPISKEIEGRVIEEIEILISGVGDCSVYEVLPDQFHQLFFDPKSSPLPENVLGHSLNLDVFCTKSTQRSNSTLLIGTKGFISQIQEWDMIKLALREDFSHSKNALTPFSHFSLADNVSFSIYKIEKAPQVLSSEATLLQKLRENLRVLTTRH
jgi:hypothetical protein